MADILAKETIEKAKENDGVEGLVYVRYFKKTLSSKNTPYLSGEIETKEKFPIIMWSRCPEYPNWENQEILNSLAYIKGHISEFAGKKSIHLDTIELKDASAENINLDDLKCLRYNRGQYESAFLSEARGKLSPKGYELFELIFEPSKEDGVWSRFKNEYAAKSYHDNCEMGLLAHTYKCLRLLDYLVNPYKYLKQLTTTNIPDADDVNDLLYLGLILHDVGKIYEMNEGLYQPDSFNSHRISGLQLLYKYEDEILNRYNKHWLEALASILVGHHNGEGGAETAKTVYAFIIHKIDNMEATFTGLGQYIEGCTFEGVDYAKVTWEGNILAL